jgi:hypothetical protein
LRALAPKLGIEADVGRYLVVLNGAFVAPGALFLGGSAIMKAVRNETWSVTWDLPVAAVRIPGGLVGFVGRHLAQRGGA